MAIIENHPIKKTVNLALKYGKGDKVAERKEGSMEGILHETIDGSELVIYKTFTTALNQNEPGDIYNSFKRNMQLYGQKELKEGNKRTKDGMPIIAWHYIQSFEGQVDAVLANEVGVKLAEKVFRGFPVQISTHTDKENTHNHIIICAWANDGHKWNQDNRTYQKVREESDHLCDEYGLSVLEATRKQRLVEWTDGNGQKRYFEPTERKGRLVEMREEGTISTDDVGSYRNTGPYREGKGKVDALTDVVRKDIDRLVPHATDYEDLLRMLRESGYVIRDKKKDGSWLAHVTFLPPGAGPGSRGKRDRSLSEDGRYTREELEKLIARNVLGRQGMTSYPAPEPIPDPVVMGTYDLNGTDVTKLDENYRTEVDGKGGRKVFPRGEVERDLILDVKWKHEEALSDLIDVPDVDRLLKERGKGGGRKERLIREIKENLENLSFVERNKVHTYAQANAAISALWKGRRACERSLGEAKKALRLQSEVLNLPSQLKAMKERVRDRGRDPGYVSSIEHRKDLRTIEALEDAIQRYGVGTEEGIGAFTQVMGKREGNVQALERELERTTQLLTGYQRCMEVMRRVDRDRGNKRWQYFKDYDAIVGEADQEGTKDPGGARKERDDEGRRQKGLDR